MKMRLKLGSRGSWSNNEHGQLIYHPTLGERWERFCLDVRQRFYPIRVTVDMSSHIEGGVGRDYLILLLSWITDQKILSIVTLSGDKRSAIFAFKRKDRKIAMLFKLTWAGL